MNEFPTSVDVAERIQSPEEHDVELISKVLLGALNIAYGIELVEDEEDHKVGIPRSYVEGVNSLDPEEAMDEYRRLVANVTEWHTSRKITGLDSMYEPGSAKEENERIENAFRVIDKVLQ